MPAYLWGSIDRTVSPASSVASNTLTKTYSTSVSSYKLDFGVQWEQPVGKKDRLTIGAVVGLGHNLKNDAEMTIISKNSVSSTNDTTPSAWPMPMALPMSFRRWVAYSTPAS